MQKIQYCRCKINLAGQNCHTVIFNEFNPVTWPEVQILMQLHGEENVMDISPVGIGETYPSTEKNRLVSLYGGRVVETCFPGRAFRMDYMMTADEDLPKYDKDGQMVNPLLVAEPVLPGPAIRREDLPLSEQGQPASTLEPIFKPGRHKPSPTPAA